MPCSTGSRWAGGATGIAAGVGAVSGRASSTGIALVTDPAVVSNGTGTIMACGGLDATTAAGWKAAADTADGRVSVVTTGATTGVMAVRTGGPAKSGCTNGAAAGGSVTTVAGNGTMGFSGDGERPNGGGVEFPHWGGGYPRPAVPRWSGVSRRTDW